MYVLVCACVCCVFVCVCVCAKTPVFGHSSTLSVIVWMPQANADKMIEESRDIPGVEDTGKLNATEQGQAHHWGDKK